MSARDSTRMRSGDRIEVRMSRQSRVLAFARAELLRYLAAALGGAVTVTEDPGVAAVQVRFEAGPGDSFCRDQVEIRVAAGSITISGDGDRAVLHGVYWLLEHRIGITWLRPGQDHVPLQRQIALAPETVRLRPPLTYRGYYLDSGAASVTADGLVAAVDWMCKRRGNYLLVSVNFYADYRHTIGDALADRGVMLEVGHHGFCNFVPPEHHFEAHPEWFSLVDGQRARGVRRNNMLHHSQLCVTNRQVQALYLDRIDAYLDANPAIDIFGVIPNDGRGWCSCPSCLALEDADAVNPVDSPVRADVPGVASGRYHALVERVALHLERHAPGTRVSFWAYQATLPPSSAVTRFPSNTLLSGLALFERCYAHAIDDPACSDGQRHLNHRFGELFDAWRDAFAGDIIIYEYYAKYAWMSLPKLMPEVIAADLQRYEQRGIEGVISMIELDNWDVYALNHAAQFEYAGTDHAARDADTLQDLPLVEAPSAAAAATVRKTVATVREVMRPYGLPGGRYPDGTESSVVEVLQECAHLLADCTDHWHLLATWHASVHLLSQCFDYRALLRSLAGSQRVTDDQVATVAATLEALDVVFRSGAEAGAVLVSEFSEHRFAAHDRKIAALHSLSPEARPAALQPLLYGHYAWF